MKKWVLILLGLLATSTSNAQEKKFDFNCGGGYSFINNSDNFKAYWKNGFNFNLTGYYKLTEVIQTGILITCSSFQLEGKKYAEQFIYQFFPPEHNGGKTTITTLMPIVRHNLNTGRNLIPFLETGAGIFHLKTERINRTWTMEDWHLFRKAVEETALGLRFGGGIEIKTENIIDFIIDLNFVLGLTKDRRRGFITSGIRLCF